MAKTHQMPSPMSTGNPRDGSSLGVSLSITPKYPDGSPADHQTPNTATAKVTLGSSLENNYWVQFKINGGSAVFTDPDPGTDGKQATVQTKGMGRAIASFIDDVAENTQTMTATVVKDDHGKPITNGPSDTKPFAFKQVPGIYGLTFFKPPLVDNQPADGKSEDAGRAIVTKNGKPLGTDETVIVVFTSSSDTTSFDLTKPYVVQNGSSSQKLLVQTHNEGGQTIADAYFTDIKSENGVTLTGVLQNDASATDTQNFTFAAQQNRTIRLLQLVNWAKGDGSATNRVMASVMKPDGELDTSYTGKVVFTLQDSAASFVGPSNPNAIGGLATVDFACSNPETLLPKNVTVYAQLEGDSASQVSQGFGFTGSEYIITARVGEYVDIPHSNPQMIDVYYKSLFFDFVEHTVCASLSLDNSAYFPAEQPQKSPFKIINPKCCSAPITQAFDENSDMPQVLITATNPNGKSETVTFTLSLIDGLAQPSSVDVTLAPQGHVTKS